MVPRLPPSEPPNAGPQPTHAPPQRRTPGAPTQRRWDSKELFGSEHEIEIEHGAAVYRLRLTSLGKLILTK